MCPSNCLKSRKLTPILTKFVLKYLLRAYSSLICRHCHAHAVPISCHKLSGDAYSHWHKILRFVEMFSEINLAKITPFEGHKSWSTWHEISDIFGEYFLGWPFAIAFHCAINSCLAWAETHPWIPWITWALWNNMCSGFGLRYRDTSK